MKFCDLQRNQSSVVMTKASDQQLPQMVPQITSCGKVQLLCGGFWDNSCYDTSLALYLRLLANDAQIYMSASFRGINITFFSN